MDKDQRDRLDQIRQQESESDSYRAAGVNDQDSLNATMQKLRDYAAENPDEAHSIAVLIGKLSKGKSRRWWNRGSMSDSPA